MAPGEVIDLLSTDDEALSQTVHTTKPGPSSDLFLALDNFESSDPSQGTPKRRKLSPSLSRDGDVSADFRRPVIGSQHVLPRAIPDRKMQGITDRLPVDVSDPIIFTSSAGAAPIAAGTKRRDSFPSQDQDSDDSLPDDLLSARNFTTASALSERTAALLASLSQSPRGAKSSNARKRSSDKTVGKSKSRQQETVDEHESDDHQHNIAGEAKEFRTQRKSKLTAEEKAAKEKDREREKAAKAREKESAKAASREQKAKDKEEDQEKKRLLKEEKAREKRIAADLAEVNKSKIDKKDSTPEMIVDLPASIDGQSVDTQIREFLKNLGVDATLYQSAVPNVVRWRRKIKARWNADLDYWEPLERMEIHEEKHVLCIVSAKEFVALAMVQNGNEDIENHVTRLKSAYDGCKLIYLIEGLHIWMRKNRTAENRAYQEKVNSLGQMNADGAPSASQHASRKKKSVPEFVDEDMVEDALLRLQVIHESLVHHTNTSVETAEWVANFTQHISTIPYRTQRMNLETSFCMESGQVKTGEDKDDTFVKMLQEIVRVTPSIAYGIASEYPNVVSLVKAFRKHGPLVLEDLQKSANRNGALTDRKIGPAISRRLYKVFTELDPASTDV